MQSRAIDDRREIDIVVLDGGHLEMCWASTKWRIWQQRVREVEMRQVRVHCGDTSTL